MSELVSIMGVLAVSGAVAGFLAGMLGIGGGIIMVPALYSAFAYWGAPVEWHMHLAVATSLAIIVPTSISSARSHHARGAVDFAVIKSWGPGIVLGAVSGVWMATRLDSTSLITVFSVLAFIMGLKLILPLEDLVVGDQVPGGAKGWFAGAPIGFLSTLMGIGGATFSVPTMTLFGTPIHRAVGTASLIGLLISVPSALGYVVTGWHVAGLPPYSFGFINAGALLVVAPVAFLAAPFGARVAHSLARRRLSVIFGAFLILTSIRFIFEL